jgi:acyl carrier protein
MELLTRVQDALASMDIEDAVPHKLLGEDLGMDSQELVCAATHFEKLFLVRIEDDELSRDMSVLDLTTMISRKLTTQTSIGPFDHALNEDATIAAPLDAVYQALFDAGSWPQKLPHVRNINMLYDDGVYQEFDMEVEGNNGTVMLIRSVRRCQPQHIRFFQPAPPKFMAHHCGEWILHPLQEGLTHVVTRHEWRLVDNAGEFFPYRDGATPARRVHAWLAEHARFALKCWKSHFEGGRAS